MALKDLKSDLSKFRRPIEKPLSDKKRVDIPKSTNQTPLSQFVDNAPNAPKSNTTTPKQGVTPNKFDNSSKHLGEVTPSKFDNSSNYLGETTPSKMSLEERFLGQTETQEVNQGDKFKGETKTENITQGDRFKGQTTPQDYSGEEKFKGETSPSEFRFTQNFLGETTPTEFSLTERFLGETTPNVFGFSEKFLGETTPVDFNLSDKFLGETIPNGFTFNPNFDNQAKDPKFVDFITDDNARGFSPFQEPKNDSTFVGVDPSQTKFDNTNSLLSQFGSANSGISFQAGYGKYKVGDPTGDTQRYSPDGSRYIDSYTSIGSMMEKRNSPSFLDEMYHKFNLKDDSPNSLNIIKAPYILRGIQRKKITKGEPQFWDFGLGVDDGLIRGGIVASTTRALVDVARIGSFFLSAKGLLWGVRQIGLQRSQKYGKTWTPINLLASLGGQHLGLKFDRPDLIPLGKQGWKYNPNASINVSPLKNIWSVFSLRTRIDVGPLNQDLKGGFDSVYGIGTTSTSRFTNTFDNEGQRYGNNIAFIGAENRFSIGTTQPYTRKKKDNPVLFAGKRYESQISDSIRENEDGTKTTLAKQTQKNSQIPIDKVFKERGLYESEGKTAGFGNDIKDYEAISYGTITKIANGDNPSDYMGDFRGVKTQKYGNNVNPDGSTDYTTHNLETTYGIPSTYKTNLERNATGNAVAKIDSVYEEVFNETLKNDLVHLFFAYDNSDGTQDSSKIIQFRSTISGVTETFSPSWNGIKYPGRADKAYMYSEFERTLSFNFKAYASSRNEMKNMWKKLSELSKLTMPTYGSAYSGHICYFSLGQLWGNAKQGVPSLITSLSYTIPDDLSWDINHDGELAELPIGADVSIGLTILPDTIYKSNKNHYSFYDTKAF